MLLDEDWDTLSGNTEFASSNITVEGNTVLHTNVARWSRLKPFLSIFLTEASPPILILCMWEC